MESRALQSSPPQEQSIIFSRRGRICSRSISSRLTEFAHRFVHVTPGPVARWNRAHDRMPRLMEVPGRVLLRRGVATADVAAGLTLTQSDPHRSFYQAVLARIRSFQRWKVSSRQSFDMFAWLCHRFSLYRSGQFSSIVVHVAALSGIAGSGSATTTVLGRRPYAERVSAVAVEQPRLTMPHQEKKFGGYTGAR